MSYGTRVQAISQVTDRKPLPSKIPQRLEALWATDVFTLSKMQASLPKDVFKSVKNTILTGGKLDVSIAGAVAAAMKDWATSKGALYYAHVFYPMTNATAEKHDGFISVQSDGSVITEFTGKVLVQGNRTAPPFLTADFAPPLKRGVTPLGMSPVQPTSWRRIMVSPCVSPRFSSLGQEKPSTKKRRFYARFHR